MSKILKVLRKLGLLLPKVSLRTGAWHPLQKFSGCPGTRGTRGTRTAAAPAVKVLEPYRIQFAHDQGYVKLKMDSVEG